MIDWLISCENEHTIMLCRTPYLEEPAITVTTLFYKPITYKIKKKNGKYIGFI